MKFCTNCGKECSDGTRFCPSCGMPLTDMVKQPFVNELAAGSQTQNYYSAPVKSRSNGFAVASLVLSLCGILTGFFAVALALFTMNIGLAFLLLIPSLLGPVFGILALVRIHKDPSYKGTGLAVAGIVVGGLVFTVFFLACNILITTAQYAQYYYTRGYDYIDTGDISDLFELFR